MHDSFRIKKTGNLSCPSCILSDSNRIQTYNLLIRSQMLYSVELWSRCFLNCDAKVLPFFDTTKCIVVFFVKMCNFLLFSAFWRLIGVRKSNIEPIYCSINRLLRTYQPNEIPALTSRGAELL